MKKNIFLYFMSVVLMTAYSCSSQFEDMANKPVSNDDMLNVYNQWRAIGAEMNKSALTAVGANSARGTSKDDIVGYLLTLSPEQIDSLYYALDVENHEKQTDAMVSAKLDRLMNICPSEDIAKLFEFVDDYVLNGGHSVEFIEIGIEAIQCDTIKSLAINTAAIYDEITSEEVALELAQKSRTTRSCVLQLALDCGGVAMELGTTAMDIATQDWGFLS